MVSSQAMVSLIIEFEGRTAHAAGDPWNGRSAVDAAELFTHGINMMREHIKPTSRMHYVILAGGDVPNVVPAYAKVSLWLRDWKRDEVEGLLARTRKVAEGAATMTETTAKVTVDGGSWDMLVNETGARLLHANLLLLDPVKYTNEEQAFAKQIQKATGVPEIGMFQGVKPLEGQAARGRLDRRRGHQLGASRHSTFRSPRRQPTRLGTPGPSSPRVACRSATRAWCRPRRCSRPRWSTSTSSRRPSLPCRRNSRRKRAQRPTCRMSRTVRRRCRRTESGMV